MNEQNVWVFVEQHRGIAAEVSLELLSRGRELADRLGAHLEGVLLGADLKDLPRTLISHGCDRVLAVSHPILADYETLPYARTVADLARARRPAIILYGASTTGRDLAPRVASALLTGLTADCTDLKIGSYSQGQASYADRLLQIRPAFGGNIMATIVTPEHLPQMATVREGVMRMPEPDQTRRGEVVEIPFTPAPDDGLVELVERIIQERTVNLKKARVIVSGGMGVGGPEGFELVRELAKTLGGEVGASRAAVDAGFIARDHQVGQTGTTVRPRLYIACGISGSVQHRAGMDQSNRIVSINLDPDAPIHQVAHYAIVADLFDVIPRMIRAYKER